MVIKDIKLCSYFYSSASWRVRAVLAHKNIPFQYENIPLLEGTQRSENYTATNPMEQVPSLKFSTDDGKSHALIQSLSIIRFLEENFPDNSVYPKDPIKRAQSNAIADTISAGIQPLQNLETLVKYGEPLGLGLIDADTRKKVAQYWLEKKLTNLEKLVKMTAGKFCVGDELSIADICLVPQMFNARRFELDTNMFPILKEIDERLCEMHIFKVSHPLECPDAPKK